MHRHAARTVRHDPRRRATRWHPSVPVRSRCGRLRTSRLLHCLPRTRSPPPLTDIAGHSFFFSSFFSFQLERLGWQWQLVQSMWWMDVRGGCSWNSFIPSLHPSSSSPTSRSISISLPAPPAAATATIIEARPSSCLSSRDSSCLSACLLTPIEAPPSSSSPPAAASRDPFQSSPPGSEQSAICLGLDLVRPAAGAPSATPACGVRRQGMSTTKVKRRVGKYELGRTIGEGTFAKVRFARDTVTGEAVAIKILDKEKVLKHKMVEQIKREISTMKLIKHPNVVRIYEVMGSKTKIYIVLEFATGGELFDTIVNHGRMREDEARRYFQQLINAVDYCHSRGVYHRDLKPENLLLDSYGNLKVSDFGLSALSQQIKDDGLLHTTCGTPNYVAPEVLEDQGYDGAMADLWSCGVILFVLLAGYLPFEDSNLMTLYKKISNAEFTFPPWTSFPAKRLLTRILDPNPMTRITIPEILEDEWFKKGYKRPEFDEQYDTTLDDVDAVFNDSEEHHVTEKKEEEPVALNAFELISMSAGLNLGNLFDSEQEFKRETRFTSKCPPKEIVRKIEEAAKPLGFDVQKKNYKLRLEKVKAGRKGNLNVATEILQVAPSLHMVEVRKAKGDTLEFHKFYKNLSKTLKDVVWKSDDLQMQYAA